MPIKPNKRFKTSKDGKPNGETNGNGKGHAEPKFSPPRVDTPESLAVQQLAKRLPKMMVRQSVWNIYNEKKGCWEVESDGQAWLGGKVYHMLDPMTRTNHQATQITNAFMKFYQTDNGIVLHGSNRFGLKGERVVLVNVLNGVVKLESDKDPVLLEHSPTYHFTSCLEVEFDPASECPIWERELVRALPDVEDVEAVMLCTANILLPHSKHETVLVCYGPEATGKSTVMESGIGNVFKGAITSLSMQQLCGANGGYDLPDLEFAIANFCTEMNSLEVDSSSNIKQIVSGEGLRVARKYGKGYDMRTTCKLVFLSNEFPRFKHGTGAETRRIRMIHFDQTIPEKDRDNRIGEMIKKEASGIFNRILNYYSLVADKTDIIPQGGEKSQAIKERFSETNNLPKAFMDEWIQKSEGGTVQSQTLRAAIWEFLYDRGSQHLAGFLYRKLLETTGVQPKRLRESPDTLPDAEPRIVKVWPNFVLKKKPDDLSKGAWA